MNTEKTTSTTKKAPIKRGTAKTGEVKKKVNKSKTLTVSLPKKLEDAFNTKVSSGFKNKSEVIRGLIEEWVSK